MKKILAVLRPFSMKQQILVYENGNKLDAATPTINELNETIINLAEKYELDQIDFHGSKHFAKGIIEQLERAQMAKYNEHILTCKII